MKQIKYIKIICNTCFLVMLLLGCFASLHLSRKDDSGIVKEDFEILEENSEISALYYDGTHVWIGTNRGVNIYGVDSLELVKTIDDLELIYSAGITASHDGRVWIGHEEGLTSIDHEFNRIEFTYPDIVKGRINTVCCLNDNTILCGSYNGLSILRYEDSNWVVDQTLTSTNGLTSDSVNVILPTANGLLIGSYLDMNSGGITYIDNANIKHKISVQDGLAHPYITSMIELTNKEVLVGTGYMDTGGLSVLQYKNGIYEVSHNYTKEEGLPGDKIRSLYEHNEIIWITTEYDGILVVREEDFINKEFGNGVYLKKENGLSDNEIKCVINSGDKYWLGGKYGVTIIPQNRFRW